MTDNFLSHETLAETMAALIAVHVGANNDLAYRDLPLSIIINRALVSDIWRCRFDGPVPNPRYADTVRKLQDDYDTEFFLALGEACSLLESHPMMWLMYGHSTYALSVYTHHSQYLRDLTTSARLAYFLRGAHEQFLYGVAY